jgi:hypothetical protein
MEKSGGDDGGIATMKLVMGMTYVYHQTAISVQEIDDLVVFDCNPMEAY